VLLGTAGFFVPAGEVEQAQQAHELRRRLESLERSVFEVVRQVDANARTLLAADRSVAFIAPRQTLDGFILVQPKPAQTLADQRERVHLARLDADEALCGEPTQTQTTSQQSGVRAVRTFG